MAQAIRTGDVLVHGHSGGAGDGYRIQIQYDSSVVCMAVNAPCWRIR